MSTKDKANSPTWSVSVTLIFAGQELHHLSDMAYTETHLFLARAAHVPRCGPAEASAGLRPPGSGVKLRHCDDAAVQGGDPIDCKIESLDVVDQVQVIRVGRCRGR